jgi:hypothetical protein
MWDSLLVTPGRALLLVGAVAALACGGNGTELAGDAGHDHTTGPDAGGPSKDAPDDRTDHMADVAVDARAPYPAPHPPMPEVVSLGGPILAHPRIVPVFYEGDPLRATVSSFLGKLTTSTYWAGATLEYGVGPLVVTAPATVPGTPPTSLTDSDIQDLVRAHLNGETSDGGVDGGGAWPTPDTDTVYALFFAETTRIAFDGVTSCTDFAGYHSEVTFAGGTTSYAVLPRCAAFPLLPGKGALDILTVGTSHELAEASTDPFPFTNPAFLTADRAGSGWSQATVGGEIGDMCVLEPSSFITPKDLGFLVQRVWSNANALEGRDPCAPVPPGEVYFNAVPDLTKTEMKSGTYVQGIRVVPGGSTTTELHLFSQAGTAGPFTIAASEAGELATRIPPDPLHQLSFSLDRATGENGDTLKLTIHRKALATGEKRSGLAFEITSTLGTASHSYWGIAGYD